MKVTETDDQELRKAMSAAIQHLANAQGFQVNLQHEARDSALIAAYDELDKIIEDSNRTSTEGDSLSEE